MSFSNQEDVLKYLGGIWETAYADPEIGPKLKATGLALTFAYSDPDTRITFDTADGRVALGDIEGVSPSATMSMTSDIANRYWQGKVNLPIAMAKGQIKVTGNVASLLKLAPLGKKLYPLYTGLLENDGRTDLVAS